MSMLGIIVLRKNKKIWRNGKKNVQPHKMLKLQKLPIIPIINGIYQKNIRFRWLSPEKRRFWRDSQRNLPKKYAIPLTISEKIINFAP
jgi:hypothetical protein